MWRGVKRNDIIGDVIYIMILNNKNMKGIEKITKGEWRVAPRVTNGTKGWEIQFNNDDECITDHVYELADAKLIAAAPDILKALNEIYEYGVNHRTEKDARLALEKALK